MKSSRTNDIHRHNAVEEEQQPKNQNLPKHQVCNFYYLSILANSSSRLEKKTPKRISRKGKVSLQDQKLRAVKKHSRKEKESIRQSRQLRKKNRTNNKSPFHQFIKNLPHHALNFFVFRIDRCSLFTSHSSRLIRMIPSRKSKFDKVKRRTAVVSWCVVT